MAHLTLGYMDLQTICQWPNLRKTRLFEIITAVTSSFSTRKFILVKSLLLLLQEAQEPSSDDERRQLNIGRQTTATCALIVTWEKS